MEVVRLAMDLTEMTSSKDAKSDQQQQGQRDESKAKHKAKRNESIKGCMDVDAAQLEVSSKSKQYVVKHSSYSWKISFMFHRRSLRHVDPEKQKNI